MNTTAIHQQTGIAWDQAAKNYEQDEAEHIDFLRSGGNTSLAPEQRILGDLRPWRRRAIHLQCAGGTDTLSLLAQGAQEVVGTDISPRMIGVARRKAEALDAPAAFFVCDTLQMPQELDGTADLVYTGRGALPWMMDIGAWAKVTERLLKPGGKLHVFEGHPLDWVWDMEASEYRLDPLRGDYFSEQLTDLRWPNPMLERMNGDDEAIVVQLWDNLKSSEYDFLKWNCASVCKLIILGSAPSRDASAQEFAVSVSELARLNDPEELLAALKTLSASPFAVSHPEELRRLAEAYAVADEVQSLFSVARLTRATLRQVAARLVEITAHMRFIGASTLARILRNRQTYYFAREGTSMLVLIRKLNQAITIGNPLSLEDAIEITVVGVRGAEVKLGVTAPPRNPSSSPRDLGAEEAGGV